MLCKKKAGILIVDSAFRGWAGPWFDSSVKPDIPETIRVKIVHQPGKAARELSKGTYPLAIVEHFLVGKIANPEMHWAHDFLPQLIDVAPETRFIITCHQRGWGIGKDRVKYEDFGSVIKTMGWIYTKANSKFILRTIKELYEEE